MTSQRRLFALAQTFNGSQKGSAEICVMGKPVTVPDCAGGYGAIDCVALTP